MVPIKCYFSYMCGRMVVQQGPDHLCRKKVHRAVRGLGRGPDPGTMQCCIPPPGSRLRPRLPALRKTKPLNTYPSSEPPLTCPLPPSSLRGKNTEGEEAHSSPPICSDFQHCTFVEASGQHQPSSLAFETGHSPLSGWYCVFLPSAPGSGWGRPHAFPSVTAQLAAPGETLTPPHHCPAAAGGTATRREKTRAVRCPRPGGPCTTCSLHRSYSRSRIWGRSQQREKRWSCSRRFNLQSGTSLL